MYYRSSKLFGALKATDEKIKENYSSGQYMDVLDELLYKALRPMLESSSWMTGYMGNVIGWYANNNKRKISKVAKPKLLTLMTTFLMLRTTDDKIECLKLMRLERSFLFGALSDWLKIAQHYNSAVIRWECSGRADNADHQLIQELFAVLQPNGERDLYCAAQDTEFWDAQAREFKGAIMEKFYRSMIMEAQSVYVRTDHRVSLDDLIQDLTLITSKAIDKFDQTKGTLTSYIEYWWTCVKNNAVDDMIKHDNQVSLEEHTSTLASCAAEGSVEDTLIKREQERRIQELAKAVDPVGLGRIMLGIYDA